MHFELLGSQGAAAVVAAPAAVVAAPAAVVAAPGPDVVVLTSVPGMATDCPVKSLKRLPKKKAKIEKCKLN